MNAKDLAIKLDEIDTEIDDLMLQLTDLHDLRSYVWTQWQLAMRKEQPKEDQLEIAV